MPCVRHDMSRSEWCSVARILIAGVKVGHYPLALLRAIMVSALFGENKLPDNMLISSFKNYVSLEEKENIDAMLQIFEEGNAELLELLSFYNCYKKPTKENLSIVLQELAHPEIVQKPRYIANCCVEVVYASKSIFNTIEQLFYQSRLPTAKKVINTLKCDIRNDAQRAAFNHLTRYIKSLSKDDLMTLLRFITDSDLAPDAIVVNFEEQVFRAPSVRTCGNILNLSASYSCYNELAEEFTNVLRNKVSFTFHSA